MVATIGIFGLLILTRNMAMLERKLHDLGLPRLVSSEADGEIVTYRPE